MANRSYLSRTAGTETASLVLKPPRLLFAPSAPESPVPEVVRAPRNAPVVAPAFVSPVMTPSVAEPGVLPRSAASIAPSVTIPEERVARVLPTSVARVPGGQEPIAADEPMVHEVVRTSVKTVGAEPPVLVPGPTKKNDDSPVKPKPRLPPAANVAPAWTPVKPVMNLRPPEGEAKMIRLEPPAPQPPMQSMDAEASEARVRIGSLEVRIVRDGPPAPAVQPQAAGATPVRTPRSQRPSAPLSRGFRAFGLPQG